MTILGKKIRFKKPYVLVHLTVAVFGIPGAEKF
jgi:hypothetical protein